MADLVLHLFGGGEGDGGRLLAPGQPSRRHGHPPPQLPRPVGAQVDEVGQRQVYCGHDRQIRGFVLELELRQLDAPPGLFPARQGFEPAGMGAPELGDDHRELGQAGVAADGGDELEHLLLVRPGQCRVGVRLALVPEQPGDSLAGQAVALEQRAVEGGAVEVVGGGAPLIHAGAALGGAEQPLGDAVAAEHLLAEGDARPDPAVEVLDDPFQRAWRELGVAMGVVRRQIADVQRVLGHAPGAVEVARPNQRMRVGGRGQLAAALHVALSGEQPDVADEDVGDFQPSAAALEGQQVRPSRRDARDGRRPAPALGLAHLGVPEDAGVELDLGDAQADVAGTLANAADNGRAAVVFVALQHLAWRQAVGDGHEFHPFVQSNAVSSASSM